MDLRSSCTVPIKSFPQDNHRLSQEFSNLDENQVQEEGLFSHLPNELKGAVLSYADFESLATVAHVSKNFNQIASFIAKEKIKQLALPLFAFLKEYLLQQKQEEKMSLIEKVFSDWQNHPLTAAPAHTVPLKISDLIKKVLPFSALEELQRRELSVLSYLTPVFNPIPQYQERLVTPLALTEIKAIFKELASQGYIAQILFAADAIISESDKDFALLDTVNFLLSKGNLEEAKQVASFITDSNSQGSAGEAICLHLLSKGNIEEAKQAFSLITSPFYRITAFEAIFKALLSRGNIKRAKEFASLADNDKCKNRAYEAICKALAYRGNIKRAKEVASLIDDGKCRNSAYKGIFKSLLFKDDIKGVKEVASLIDDQYKERVFKEIYFQLICDEDFIRAGIVASFISNEIRSQICFDRCKYLLSKSDIKGSEKVARSISVPILKSQAYEAICKALLSKDDIKGAAKNAAFISDHSYRKKLILEKIRNVLLSKGDAEELELINDQLAKMNL